MLCHKCREEAAGKCKHCGLAFCSGHGATLCRTCAVGIMSLEPARAIALGRIQRSAAGARTSGRALGLKLPAGE